MHVGRGGRIKGKMVEENEGGMERGNKGRKKIEK